MYEPGILKRKTYLPLKFFEINKLYTKQQLELTLLLYFIIIEYVYVITNCLNLSF